MSERFAGPSYRGEIDLEPTSEGTAIRWVSTFDPKVPGTGGLMRRGLARFIAQCTDGLAEHAASLVGGRSAS